MLKYIAIALLLLPLPSPQPAANKGNNSQRTNSPQLAATPLNSPDAQTPNPSPKAPESQPEQPQRQADAAKAAQATNDRIARATDVIAFFGGLSFLAACGYIVAALLQWSSIKKQAKAAGDQVDKMQSQLDAMHDALEITERARLGIHSIKENFETRKVLIRIENVGRASATDIEVSIEGEVRIPQQYLPRQQTKMPLPWKHGGNDWYLTWPLPIGYGHTELLAGNFPLLLPFSLASWLDRPECDLVKKGAAQMIFRGEITFHDGFKADRKTEFAFRYSKDVSEWVHHPINTPEEVWAKLREAMGDRDPSKDWRITNVRVPREPTKIEEKGDEN